MVQSGEQTAAMASGYPHLTQRARNKAKEIFDRCSESLPYERHNQLLDNEAGARKTDLRMENVFAVDMLAFPEEYRMGE